MKLKVLVGLDSLCLKYFLQSFDKWKIKIDILELKLKHLSVLKLSPWATDGLQALDLQQIGRT